MPCNLYFYISVMQVQSAQELAAVALALAPQEPAVDHAAMVRHFIYGSGACSCPRSCFDILNIDYWFFLLFLIGRDLAIELLNCVYTAYFPPRPRSERAIQLWIDAFREREKVPGAANHEKNKITLRANDFVCQALAEEEWLPFRYACLWYYNGTSPLILDRIEYDAVFEILSSLSADERSEEQRMLLGWVTGCREKSPGDNEYRLSIVPDYKTQGAPAEGCVSHCSACFKVPGRGEWWLCSPQHRGQNWMAKHRERILHKDFKLMDPGEIFSQLIGNWPASAAHEPDKNPFFPTVVNGVISKPRRYFSTSTMSPYAKEFCAEPAEFKALLQKYMGGTSSTSAPNRYDVAKIFEELHSARNKVIICFWLAQSKIVHLILKI
jgi:hypothetical protein